MPELPEVRTVVKYLDKSLKDKTITDIKVNMKKLIKDISANEFINTLKNKKILSVSNVGKFIVFFLSDDLVMLSHLRMEGKYHFDEWENKKHDHVIFTFDDGIKLHYNDTRQFGTFHLKNLSNYLTTKPLSEMGPEPINKNQDELYQQLKNKRIPIKAALLDQSILSGLGNIYVDEVLWDVKLNANTPAKDVSLEKQKQILKSAHSIMEASTLKGGTTIRSYTSIDKVKGEYQNDLKVHMQQNKDCKRCGTKISKTKVGGRGTYWCSKCQGIA